MGFPEISGVAWSCIGIFTGFAFVVAGCRNLMLEGEKD
jgi:hypothetical protein